VVLDGALDVLDDALEMLEVMLEGLGVKLEEVEVKLEDSLGELSFPSLMAVPTIILEKADESLGIIEDGSPE
jgi:hypothetical protein